MRHTPTMPVVRYTLEEQAAYLLENAIDVADYDGARAAVRAMGLDPDTIPHAPPPAVARRSELATDV